MMMKELFQEALNIKAPWIIEEIKFNSESKLLDVIINFKKGSTFSYELIGENGEIETIEDLKAYDTQKKSWQHLNFFEHRCYLHARVPRVQLPNGKVKVIKTPWEGESKGFTLLFEALLMQLMEHMAVDNVAKMVGVSGNKLWDMLDRYIVKARETEDFSDVKEVGMDETSRAKGHEYITLFVDLEKRRTIYVTEGKDNKTVEKFRKDLEAHNGVAENITDMSCDMSPAFTKGIGENLPKAEITYDKFHIIKLLNEAVDKVRKSEANEHKVLKGTKYVFLKNVENLTDKQKEKLEECSMSEMDLKTLEAYKLKKMFQDIYKAKTEEEFVTYLEKWYSWAIESELNPMMKVAKTIKKHWDGIVRYFSSKLNNGILEGLNSLIQATKSRARGYKTIKNYVNIVYLITGKLDFSIVNQNIRKL